MGKIFSQDVPVGYFSESRVQVLLQTLVAKTCLSDEEVVGALCRRRTKLANDLLKVTKNGLHPDYSCGINPWFQARIIVVPEVRRD